MIIIINSETDLEIFPEIIMISACEPAMHQCFMQCTNAMQRSHATMLQCNAAWRLCHAPGLGGVAMRRCIAPVHGGRVLGSCLAESGHA
jgi:hypothetical protein